jgi:hypothetical protein
MRRGPPFGGPLCSCSFYWKLITLLLYRSVREPEYIVRAGVCVSRRVKAPNIKPPATARKKAANGWYAESIVT